MDLRGGGRFLLVLTGFSRVLCGTNRFYSYIIRIVFGSFLIPLAVCF